MAKKPETKVNNEVLTQGVTDAAHMLLPLTVLFEHPGNRARIYGEEALAGLKARILGDPRGIARHPLTVTPAHDAEGVRLRVMDLCTDALLASNENLASFVADHPEMKTSETEAWYVTSGNQRLKNFRELGMEQAPVVAQEMTLKEQVRDLVQANNGQPLTRLEIGRFYLEEEKIVGHRGVGRKPKEGDKEGLSIRRFAEEIGRSSSLVHDCVLAARVYNTLSPEAQKLIERANDGTERFLPDHLMALQAIPDIERRSEFVRHAIAPEPEKDERGNPTGRTRWEVKVSPTELKAIIGVRVKGERPETAFKAVWGELGIEDLISPEIVKAIEAPTHVPEEDEGAVVSPRAAAAPPAAAPPAAPAGKKGKQAPPAPQAMTKAERAAAKKAQKEADRAAFVAAQNKKKQQQAAKLAAGKKSGVAPVEGTRDEERQDAIFRLDRTLAGLPDFFDKVSLDITESRNQGLLEPEEALEFRDRLVGILGNWMSQLQVLFEGEQLSLGALATAPTLGDADAGPDGPEAPPVTEEEHEAAAVA